MIPGKSPLMYYPAQPAARDFDKEEEGLRAEIAGFTKLALSICTLLPAFVTESAIKRMGIQNIADVLENFHTELRAYFCQGLECQLASLLEYRKNPPPAYKPPKPTVEDLMQATLNVQRMEDAIQAMDNLNEKEDILGGATALMRPMVEVQLDQARKELSWIQSRMEEPDEAPMSNEEPTAKSPSSE